MSATVHIHIDSPHFPVHLLMPYGQRPTAAVVLSGEPADFVLFVTSAVEADALIAAGGEAKRLLAEAAGGDEEALS